MRAVVCKEFGPPENLVVEEVADPSPGPGQVLVDVKAAAVTFPDTLMLEDKYQYKAHPPYVPGGEVAGVVAALGEGVDSLSVGDRIVGGLGSVGGFAELAVVPAAGARCAARQRRLRRVDGAQLRVRDELLRAEVPGEPAGR